MSCLFLNRLLGFLLIGQVAAGRLPRPGSQFVHEELVAIDEESLIEPRAEEFAWIHRIAAIGDSYSAGIGAGDRLGSIADALDPQSDWACSRYDHSYPYLINNDYRLGAVGDRTFQFKSCSGALTQDVAEKQIPALIPGQQAILLSVGGNDAELTNVLNQCIYQWAVLNKDQVTVAKLAALDKNYAWARGYDWDALGRGCEGQLARTRSLIESDEFSQKIEAVLDLAIPKLSDDGMIYYTGYGKFFDEEYSGECSTVSWSTWIYKASNAFQPEAKLTYDVRRVMNALVDLVNTKLKAAAAARSDKVVFVDYDSYIGRWNGRYCEPGVDESTKESNTRPQLMFYELDTVDAFGTNPWKRSSNGDLSETFAGELDVFAEVTKLVDPNASFRDKEIDETTVGTSTLASTAAADNISSDVELLDIEVPNMLPDGYGRVFHPQILLHRVIANLVIYNMIKVRDQQQGQLEYPEQLRMDTCPASPHPNQPLHNSPHCDRNLDDMDSDLFNKLVNRFCTDHGDLTQHSNDAYTAGNVGENGYEGWRFDFIWSPTSDTAETCQHSCQQIFGQGFDTWTTGSFCTLDSHTMSRSGILQVDDCGEAFYTFVPPTKQRTTPDSEVTLLSCTTPFTHPDTWAPQQADAAAKVCARHATNNVAIEKDNPSTYVSRRMVTSKPFEPDHIMDYNIWWKHGCILNSGLTEVPIDHPLPDGGPGCTEWLTEAYANCTNNGGAGGQIQVGCLIYEYVPEG